VHAEPRGVQFLTVQVPVTLPGVAARAGLPAVTGCAPVGGGCVVLLKWRWWYRLVARCQVAWSPYSPVETGEPAGGGAVDMAVQSRSPSPWNEGRRVSCRRAGPSSEPWTPSQGP
jgi:hypothetical protein